jgi:hypothetical protein
VGLLRLNYIKILHTKKYLFTKISLKSTLIRTNIIRIAQGAVVTLLDNNGETDIEAEADMLEILSELTGAGVKIAGLAPTSEIAQKMKKYIKYGVVMTQDEFEYMYKNRLDLNRNKLYFVDSFDAFSISGINKVLYAIYKNPRNDIKIVLRGKVSCLPIRMRKKD